MSTRRPQPRRRRPHRHRRRNGPRPLSPLETLVLTAALASAAGAVAVEVRLTTRDHPQRFVWCWLAWSVPVALGVGVILPTTGSLLDVLVALAAGLSGYPLVRASIWLHMQRYNGVREAALEKARLTYQAVDFGGRRKAPEAAAPQRRRVVAADAAPITTALPARSALARVTAEGRPRWMRGLEDFIVGVICVVAAIATLGYSAWDRGRGSGPTDAAGDVAATLEMNGLAAPNVQATADDVGCEGQAFAYRWRAVGAEGRACVDRRTGEIRAFTDRRWSR